MQITSRALRMLTMAIGLAVLAAFTAGAQQPAPAAGDNVISADDDLTIDVLDVPEFSRDYRVSPAGTLTLPLLADPVRAAGLTPAALATEIGDKLRAAGMVTQPHVTVQVRESRLHSIAIMGAVKKPQIYPLFGPTTLVAALSQAEGLTEDAGSTALITRGDVAMRALRSEPPASQIPDDPGPSAPPTRKIVTVNLERLLEAGDASLNVALYPGDQVTVQRAGIVYVVGAVNRAGGFVLKDDQQMTVLKAVALAEDLKSTAAPKRAVIIRKSPQSPGASQDIPVDLAQILSGHAPDRPLLSNDILFVPDSTGKKALHRAGEAAAEAAALFVYRIP